MSLSLTYNDDLSRVQIAATNLPDVETVTIERSANGLFWRTVRGAAALPVTAGAVAVDDYEFTPDVLNHYRVRTDLPAGLYLPGLAGSYASTADDPSLDITGDVFLRIDAALDAWAGLQQVFIGKYGITANQRSYALIVLATGILRMNWSTDGAAALSGVSSIAPTVAAGERLSVASGLDVDNGAAGRTISFWTGADGSSPLTPLGSTPPQPGVTSVHSGSAELSIGAWDDGTSNPAAGVVYGGEVRSGDATGTLVAAPDFTIHPTDTPSFVDSVGRTWTVNGDARIIGDPVYAGSITPSLGGKVWLTCIEFPFLNRWVEVTDWTPINRAGATELQQPVGRSAPVAVSDIRRSQTFSIDIATRDLVDDSFDPLTEARDLDLILAGGTHFYIQVPAGSDVPGGYVSIGDTSQRPAPSRRAGVASEIFTLPCTVIVPPGPDVVGGTMTYGALLALYGDYNNVLAANPTYADLLGLMASPDDLVVL